MLRMANYPLLWKLMNKRIEEIKTAAADAALMEAMGEITQEESNLESFTELGFSEEEVDILFLIK